MVDRDFWASDVRALGGTGHEVFVRLAPYLPITRQCAPGGIRQSTIYCAPWAESSKTFAVLRAVSDLFPDTPWHAVQRMVSRLRLHEHSAGGRLIGLRTLPDGAYKQGFHFLSKFFEKSLLYTYVTGPLCL